MFLEELGDTRLSSCPWAPLAPGPCLGLHDTVRELSWAKSSPSRELQRVERKQPSSRVSQQLTAMLACVADASHRGMETLDKAVFAGKTLATTSKLATPWLLLHGPQAAVGEPHKAAVQAASRQSISRLSTCRRQSLRGRNELSRSFSLRSKGMPSPARPCDRLRPGFAGTPASALLMGFS